jgi:SpoVK/Ycf46/Vps4 family AAA+-type ATPase
MINQNSDPVIGFTGRVKELDNFIRAHPRERLLVLFGIGVLDLYYLAQGQEYNIHQVLWQVLRQQGYTNIAFFSPVETLHFLDQTSLAAALPPVRQENPGHIPAPGFSPPGPKTWQTPAPAPRSFSGAPALMHRLGDGPFQNRMLLKAWQQQEMQMQYQPASLQPARGVPAGLAERGAAYPSQERPQVFRLGQGGMGDTHAIRTLHTMMTRSENGPTAVVIQQAETSLSYFKDQRTLAGLISTWQHLPSTNRNICILIFSAASHEMLHEASRRLPLPELRNAASLESSNSQSGRNLLKLGTPAEEELACLLSSHPAGKSLSGQPQEQQTLCQWMAAEGRPLRSWLDALQGRDHLDLATASQAGWFAAIRDPHQSASDKLQQLVGLEAVKQHLREMSAWLVVSRRRQKTVPPSLHMIFAGNPGTGKTTVARLVGELYREIGLLSRGHLVEVKAGDLVADHVGGTAKKTNAAVDAAQDGILFVDEAYTLTEPERGGFGREALDTLLTRMEDETRPWVLIAAGYPEKMEAFCQNNPGLPRRIPAQNRLTFADYTPDELNLILEKMLAERQLNASEQLLHQLQRIIRGMAGSQAETFGNAGEVRNLVEALERLHALRILQEDLALDTPLAEEDIPAAFRSHLLPAEQDIASLFKELDELVGLEEVKSDLRKVAYRMQMELALQAGNPSFSPSSVLRHFVFSGNPGTGKTTVARLVGRIFQHLGVLRKGHCIEVSRSDLVAGYVGQTAIQTTAKFRQALDGVLFIDEAYALAAGAKDGFGQEAIDTLVKLMEDYKERIVVIAAGYPDKMLHFLNANPGLPSRFQKKLRFPDLNSAQLGEMLNRLAEFDRLTLPPDVLQTALAHLADEKAQNPNQFGNGRAVRQLYETMKDNLAVRFAVEIRKDPHERQEEALRRFCLDDVDVVRKP